MRGFAAAQGGEVKYEYTILPDVLNLRGIPATALTGLENIPGVIQIEEDGQLQAHLDEVTPLVGGLQPIPGFAGVKGDGVRICIIDSGIDPDHPMFTVSPTDPTSRIDSAAAWDFIGNDLVPEHLDQTRHGSHVAGISSGREGITFGGVPAQGLAPQSTIIPVKVLDANGIASDSDVIAAIQHCSSSTLPNGQADVINMSLGGGQFATDCDGINSVAIAANQAVTDGVVVVASTGNNGAGTNGFPEGIATPACGSKVIGVGATYDQADITTDPFFPGFATWCTGPNPAQDCSVTCTDLTSPDLHACFSNKGLLDVVAPGCETTSAFQAPTSSSPIAARAKLPQLLRAWQHFSWITTRR